MLVVSLASEAQPPKTMPRIGFLSVTSPAAVSVRIEAFRQGLRALGYEEGKNMVIEWQYAEGKLDRLPALAAELVRPQGRRDRHGGSATNPCRQGSN